LTENCDLTPALLKEKLPDIGSNRSITGIRLERDFGFSLQLSYANCPSFRPVNVRPNRFSPWLTAWNALAAWIRVLQTCTHSSHGFTGFRKPLGLFSNSRKRRERLGNHLHAHWTACPARPASSQEVGKSTETRRLDQGIDRNTSYN
jgi:hypothetical protein